MSTPADALDTARLAPFTPEDMPETWVRGFQATRAGMELEEHSTSRSLWGKLAGDYRKARIKEATGEDPAWYDTITLNEGPYQVARSMLDKGEYVMDGTNLRPTSSRAAAWLVDFRPVVEAAARLRELETAHPGRVPTDPELADWTTSEAAKVRALTSSDSARGPASARLAGTLVGAVEDPLILATLPLGAEAGVAKAGTQAILRTALKVGAKEAAIAATVELPIQAQVYSFKRDIQSPFDLKDATINVLAAGLGAGILRGTGSAAVDLGATYAVRGRAMLEQYAARKASGETFAPAVDRAAVELGDYLEELARNPFPTEEPHFDAIQKAQGDLGAMEQVRVDRIVPKAAEGQIDLVPGGSLPALDRFQVIDPLELGVDAARFQFKAGGDRAGVTDRLRGVERFDPKLAGQVLVYEDVAGKRWIVDGHQRVGLAKRARAAGQTPEETRLFGYVLREADGVSPSEARVVAAYKNIAEGTGTALDAAKVLREAAGGEARLPPLPPSSALVRDARGLARLADEPFMAVVNDVVPASYAASVGDLIKGEAEQSAVLKLLAKLEPQNATQARMIVEQARTAGFETRTSGDLFGDAEVAENLYLERARIFDAALRRIRRDRSTFQTLTERGETIQTEGNVLDQAANARRLDHDQETLAALTRSANQRGLTSDALTSAAREFKAGGKLADVVDRFVQAVRRGAPGPAPGGAGREAVAAANRARMARGEAPVGVLDDADPRLTPTATIQSPERDALRTRIVNTLLKGAKPAKAGQRPVAVVMAGGSGSGKDTILDALVAEGGLPKGMARLDPDEIKLEHLPEFKELAELGDYRAGMVVHEEASQLAKQAFEEALRRRLPVVWNRTMSRYETGSAELEALAKAGYEVHLIGVVTDPEVAWGRALKRFERTGRMVPRDELLAAHQGFRENVLKYAEQVENVRIFANDGPKGEPVLVARRTDGGAVEGVDAARYHGLEEVRRGQGQEAARREAGQGARADQQAGGPGEGGRGAGGEGEAPGAGRDAGQRVADEDLFGRVPAAAQALHDERLAIARGLTGEDVPMRAGPGDLFTNANRQVDLTDYLGEDAARLLDAEDRELARVAAEDIDSRVPENVEYADGRLIPTTRPLGEHLAELDQHARSLEAVKLCAVGGAGG